MCNLAVCTCHSLAECRNQNGYKTLTQFHIAFCEFKKSMMHGQLFEDGSFYYLQLYKFAVEVPLQQSTFNDKLLHNAGTGGRRKFIVVVSPLKVFMINLVEAFTAKGYMLMSVHKHSAG